MKLFLSSATLAAVLALNGQASAFVPTSSSAASTTSLASSVNSRTASRNRDLENRINEIERKRGLTNNRRGGYSNNNSYGMNNGYGSNGSTGFYGGTSSSGYNNNMGSSRDSPIFDSARPIELQGNSLKTFSFPNPPERVQVALTTQGRELEANVELWQGPGNIPVHMRVYNEDGGLRPMNVVLETPGGQTSTVAVRNTASLEFPIEARVLADNSGNGRVDTPTVREPPMIIQGGALCTVPFDYEVDRVQVLMETDGRPLNARIELLQGPNNNKQVIELYTEDGMYRPFFLILETPGAGNVVRLVNTATMEFPLSAWVEPYGMGSGNYNSSRRSMTGNRSMGSNSAYGYGSNRNNNNNYGYGSRNGMNSRNGNRAGDDFYRDFSYGSVGDRSRNNNYSSNNRNGAYGSYGNGGYGNGSYGNGGYGYGNGSFGGNSRGSVYNDRYSGNNNGYGGYGGMNSGYGMNNSGYGMNRSNGYGGNTVGYEGGFSGFSSRYN